MYYNIYPLHLNHPSVPLGHLLRSSGCYKIVSSREVNVVLVLFLFLYLKSSSCLATSPDWRLWTSWTKRLWVSSGSNSGRVRSRTGAFNCIRKIKILITFICYTNKKSFVSFNIAVKILVCCVHSARSPQHLCKSAAHNITMKRSFIRCNY